MRIPSWPKRSKTRRPRTRAKWARRNLLETLEDRRMLAVITVTELSADINTNGMVSLGEAIEAANTDASIDGSVAGAGADTIEFAPGLSGQITLTSELVLSTEIEIVGPGRDALTIDGGDVTRIFSIPDASGNVTIRSMTLTNGRTPATGQVGGGAIVFDSPHAFLLDDVVISNSTAVAGSGGAILHLQGGLVVDGSELSGNTSGVSGGAIFSNSTGLLTVQDSLVDNNQAADKGGGIFRADAALEVFTSTVSGNRTINNEGYGGGIYFTNANMTITSSTITGNSTAGTFADGGGVFSDTSLNNDTTNIVNSTVSGNTSAGRGGGVFNRDGLTVVNYSTVVNNNAVVGANGIGSYAGTDTQTVIQSSIVSANTGGGGDVDLIGGTIQSFNSGGYNLIGSGSGAINFSSNGDQIGVLNAGLGALADNGGPTQTHALLDGSVAIDSGNPSFNTSLLISDQRGLPFQRVFNNRIDIGSFELGGNPTISEIPDQVVQLSTATGNLPVTIGDAQTAVAQLVVTATSSDQTVVPDANIVLGGTGADRTINVTPVDGVNGVATITVVVTDADSLTSTETFLITVGNTAPTISDIPDQTIVQDTSTTAVPFTIADAQTALDSLSITAESTDQVLLPISNIVFTGTGADRTIVATPAAGQIGTATVTVTVTDEGALVATDTFVVTVNAVNAPPTITAVPDQTTTEGVSTLPVFFTIGDAETPVSSLAVAAVSSNQTLVPDANISITGTTAIRTISVSPVPNESGTTTISITVTDANGEIAVDTFLVTVTEINEPPTVSDVTNQTVLENTTSAPVSFRVSDAETPVAELVVTASSSNQTLLPDSGILVNGTGAGRSLTMTPAPDQVGTATITITVTDEDGLVATDTFLLNVSDVAQPGISGEVFADANNNGQPDPGEVGAFGVQVYVDANDNRILDTGEVVTQTDSLGQFFFTSLPAGDHTVRVVAPADQIQTSPQGYFGTNLNGLGALSQQTQLFEMTLGGNVRLIGSPMTEPIDALIRTNDGTLIGIRASNDSEPNDGVYSVDSVTGQETLLNLTATQLGGLAYDPTSDTIYTLAVDATAGGAVRLRTVDPVNGSLGAAVGSGLVFAGGLSINDLSFDTVNNRIVGFHGPDPTANEQFFFEFQLDGTATRLANPAQALDSNGSLAFNGSAFVMFDQVSAQSLEVDPDSGLLSAGFVASTALRPDSLTYVGRGDIAQRVTLGFNDLPNVNFGLALLDTGPDQADFPTLINEILIDPLFGTDPDQALEFRGEPGGQLNPDTYFVIVDEDGTNPGQIETIIDLSNQPLGSNGFLVLLEEGSIHQVDPASAVLQSTAPGFGGLPGGIFSNSHTLTDQLDFIVGANAYFLIESSVAPQLGDDIDGNDDGLADSDGVKSNWTVLDSISLHPAVFSGPHAYGQILLAEEELADDPNNRTVEAGTPIVVGDGFGYAARIGDSIGSTPSDWVFGTIVEAEADATGRTSLYEFTSGIFGTPVPPAFQLRDLDHFGESNFVGGVRGTVEVAPGLGQTSSTGSPLPVSPAPGLTVLADTNMNGIQDTLDFIVNPDTAVDFFNAFDALGNEIRFPLSNAFPGVTITVADDQNEALGFEVETSLEQNNFFGFNYLFSYFNGIDTFSSIRRLRFDFYNPVSEVSIDAIGAAFGLAPAIGRIDAYDANDQLIGSDLSAPLIGRAVDRISVTSANEDIAYVVAYADNSALISSFGRFDNLSYLQSEQIDITDADGKYEIQNLFPGDYQVTVQDTAGGDLIGGLPTPITVAQYENYVVNEQLRPNVAPIVDADIEFTVDENLITGDLVGIVDAIDFDRQPLTFEILSPNANGLVVDPATGAITVGPDAVIDFETLPEIDLIIGVSDAFVQSTTRVKVRLNDLNEPPVVEESVFFIAEDTVNGTTIGQVEAFDPDDSLNQQLTFEVFGGSGVDVFTVNPTNGLIILVDDSAINFETQSELNLLIRISDSSVPPLFVDIDQRIRVIDQNDSPSVATTDVSVVENSTGVVGQLTASDPDSLQTHVFELLGGTGAELFQIRRDGAIEVRNGVTIDFEQGTSYTLDVITIDSGAPPLAAEGTVTITITDVNEPPMLDQSSVTLAENSPGGTAVATFSIIDPENSGSDYEIRLLSEADGANFNFDEATKSLTVADGADLDFETSPINFVRFLITDPTNNDAPTRVTLLVELTDQNDPPLLLTQEVVISELAAPGTVVGRVEVQIREPDSGDVVTVAIEGGNAASLFTLDADTRILRVADGAQFDADVESDPLSIDVRVTDGGGLTSVGTINVTLNDVNEPPAFLGGSLSPSPVGSGEVFEIVIPTDAIVDPEGRPFSVAIFGDNEQLPDWLEFDEATRTLSGLPTPELLGTYELTLRAFEAGPLELFTDVPFQVVVQAGSTPLTNQRDPLDVDANGEVAPIDALRVINFIGRHGNGTAVTEANPFIGFVDVSGEGIVTARDALLVINGLREAVSPFGEQVDDSLLSAIVDNSDDRDEATDEALIDLLGSSLF
ncbi:MAG: cadherin domain-containing protein [Rubripirellula sp.]